MIEFALFVLMLAVAASLFLVAGHACDLLEAVTRHRNAQATSVLHHAGLLDLPSREDV